MIHGRTVEVFRIVPQERGQQHTFRQRCPRASERSALREREQVPVQALAPKREECEDEQTADKTEPGEEVVAMDACEQRLVMKREAFKSDREAVEAGRP